MVDILGMVLEILMCLGVLCFSLFVLWYVFRQAWALFVQLLWWRRSRRWVEAEGRVLNAKTLALHGTPLSLYRVEVLYEYQVNGKTYQNGRRFFGFDSGDLRLHAEKTVQEKYAKGTVVRVFYNAEKVEECVLERRCVGVMEELWMDGLLLFAGTFFTAVGIVGIVMVVTGKGAR